VCLIFGTDTGTTEEIGDKICAEFANVGCAVEMINVTDVSLDQLNKYDFIIMGIPTWDFGQIQSDWEEFWEDISEVDFSGKEVALYGLGDQFGYGDFFLDAMGMLHDVIVANGAKIVGHWSTEGYEFDASKAKIPEQDKFVGLAIDQDQQEELTSQRLNTWCQQIADEFGLDTVITPLED